MLLVPFIPSSRLSDTADPREEPKPWSHVAHLDVHVRPRSLGGDSEVTALDAGVMLMEGYPVANSAHRVAFGVENRIFPGQLANIPLNTCN